MTETAFRGDPGTKALALERLRYHIESGSFVFFPAWEDGLANVIGALIEADDKQAFAERYGFPIALVNALEVIVNAFHVLPAAQEFVEDWLVRTPVGADLSRLVPEILIYLLERPEIASTAEKNADVEQHRQAVVALHRRALAGEEVERKEWKSVRLAAISVSDAITDDTPVQLVSQIVEAAAWPGTMQSVLYDTLGACGRLESHQIMQGIGWTMENESRVFRIREQAEKDGRMAGLEGLDRVLALLDHDDPALARGFRQRLEQFGRLGGFYRDVGAKMVALCERAPIATSQSV